MRKRVLLLRMTISTVVFQKYTRRWLAIRELIRRKQNKASVSIQTKIRVYLAKKELARLKAQWIMNQKIYVCTQLQSHYRRRKAIKLRHYLKRMRCALQIQWMFRSFKARQNRKQQEIYFGKIRRIQKFIKRRHQVKSLSCTKISSLVKKHRVRKQFIKLTAINKASNKCRKLLNMRDQQFGFIRLLRDTKALNIQSCFRGIKARISYKNMLNEISILKLRHIFTKSFTRKLSHNMRFIRRFQNKQAVVIQKYARRFLAIKRVTRIRLQRKMTSASELVCRHLRGYWHRRMINWLRSQIRSVVVVQTHWRMYKGNPSS